MCRAPLVEFAARPPAPNQALAYMLQRWCAEAVAERRRAVEQEQAAEREWLPIFVCSSMFPGVPAGFHVYEPRYRGLVRWALESGTLHFGMCAHNAAEPQRYNSVGTLALIRRVRMLPDGRSVLTCEGGRRFEVVERSMRDGYEVARVRWLEDEPPERQAAEEVRELAAAVATGRAAVPLLDMVRDVRHFMEVRVRARCRSISPPLLSSMHRVLARAHLPPPARARVRSASFCRASSSAA